MNVRLKQMLAIGLAGFGLGVAGVAHAVPAVQLGLPLPGGGYAPYVGSLSDPTETDTAVTTDSPFNLAVGMAYKDQGQTSVLLMGGQYGPDGNGISGLNWSDFGYDSVFDTHGAVLMVSTAGAGTTLTIDGVSSFYHTNTFEDGFIVPNPPSNHAPVQVATDYYFFDIGDFARATSSVPNFADPGDTNVDGEVKTFTVDVAGFDWAHFDAFALETTDEIICTDTVTGKKCGKKTTLSSTIYVYDTSTAGNPGSHDVTWKPGEEDFCTTHPTDPSCQQTPEVPEIDAVAGTGALALLSGMVMLVGERRRRKLQG